MTHSSPVSDQEERLALAIRKARGFEPDTLYQHLGDDYPIDFTDSQGRTFYKSWRKELPSVRAVLAELDVTPAQTSGEPVAFVPVHPRQGPLWSDTFPAKSDLQRSENYPRMALYAAPPQPPVQSELPYHTEDLYEILAGTGDKQ